MPPQDQATLPLCFDFLPFSILPLLFLERGAMHVTADIGTFVSVDARLQMDRFPGTPSNCIT